MLILGGKLLMNSKVERISCSTFYRNKYSLLGLIQLFDITSQSIFCIGHDHHLDHGCLVSHEKYKQNTLA